MSEQKELKYEDLTEKQKRFIDYYIETANATKSCELAGYKGNNLNRLGSENLSKLDSIIQQRLKEKENKRIASADEVLEFLTKVMRKEIITPGNTDRVKCAELLGKRHKLFTEKVEVENNKPFEVNINVVNKDKK